MRRLVWTLGVLTMLQAAAWAVSSSFFEVRTADQFRKGKLDDAVVAEPGRLTLAFEKKEILKAEGEIIWSLAVDPAGAVYVGTSQKGRLYVIRDDKSSVAATVSDTAIFAVAVGPDGKVYFGGSPSGTIYKEGKLFSKTGQSYIWALLFDRKGDLYAATGPDGKLLRIDGTGKAEVVLDSSDPHLMCLARDSRGNLYAGSSKSGIIYRLAPDGTSKVIYDAAEGEIHAMAVDDKDRLYFATADVTTSSAGPLRGPMGMRSAPASMPAGEGGEGGAEKGPPSGPAPGPAAPAPAPIRDEVSATNAVYRMSADGSVVRLYTIRGKMILSLVWTGGKLYAGTGNRGDLVCIDQNLDVALLEKDLEKQVMSLAVDPKGEILAGTGDVGRVLRYTSTFPKEGLYTSDVFDAKFAARFGVVTWKGLFPAGTGIDLTTQSGNVAEPDASWSEWSEPIRSTGQAVTSPGARFLRCRVKLKTSVPASAPEVSEIRIAYLTSNQPPRIDSVKVVTSADKNREAKKPAPSDQVDISWQAEDPNADKLQYRLEFRMHGDANWRLLEEKTDKNSYTWKTDAVPDGTYEVRVIASDELDNPKDTALTHERTSQVFVVDNTKPQVTLAVAPGAPRAETVTVTMTDAIGIVRCAEYSLDSGDWQLMQPDDRIFDSAGEKATVELKDLAAGEHTITVRAYDDSGNVGSGSRTFRMR